MAEILRVKMEWSGFQGAPGVTSFYLKDFDGGDDQNGFAQQAVDRIDLFADAVATRVPSGVALKVANDVEVIDDTSGELLDVVTVSADGGRSNNSHVGQAYAAAAGMVVNWRTGSVHRGRRVRGRTFLVPIAGTEFESNGTLGGGAIDAISTAATALLNGAGTPDLGVWARPQIIVNEDGTKTKLNNGAWYRATSFNIPDMSAVLRSRRD